MSHAIRSSVAHQLYFEISMQRTAGEFLQLYMYMLCQVTSRLFSKQKHVDTGEKLFSVPVIGVVAISEIGPTMQTPRVYITYRFTRRIQPVYSDVSNNS